MIVKNKRRIAIAFAIVLLLLIPLIAMQFSTEVNWTLLDFVVAGTLLFTTGFICEFVVRKVKKSKLRIAFCLAILLAFMLIWVELAVGI